MGILQGMATIIGLIVIAIVIVVPWGVGIGLFCAELKDRFK